MSFNRWLNKVRPAPGLSQGHRTHRRRGSTGGRVSHLALEPLEDRRLMSFTPAVSYAGASNGYAIASADFDGDGNLDLATTVGYASNSKVSVRLGDGAGGFDKAQEFAVLRYDLPTSIFVADFNNDTRPDIVVSEFNGFSTLIGNGDGTFQSDVFTFVGEAVAVGDFNNDSNVDILVNWLDGDWTTHVQVYTGNGHGAFAPGGDVPYWGAGYMAAVDLNNDGLLDVATGSGLVFLNVNGWLQYDWEQQALLNGGAIATGDLTGEGNADVIVAGSDVAVLRGRGDGSFDSPIHHAAYGNGHSAVATADFNADGNLDAVVTDSDGSTVSAMLGNGDGTLRFGGAFAAGTVPRTLTVGDFNRDGRPDVAVAISGSRNLAVLLNDGDWPTVPPPPLRLSIGDTAITEGNAGTLNANFTVTLTQPSTVDVTVRYETTNISATAETDYVATSGTLTIPAGQISRTLTVPIQGDRLAESAETFTVNLSSPTNASITDGQAIGTILDNEPQISITDVTRAEGGSRQTTVFVFTVTLSAPYDQPVTVSFRTVNGTAKSNQGDYVDRTGTLTFAPGETSKTIAIEVNGDRKRESNEMFYVDLFGNSGNSLFTKSRGIGTILNDD